MKLKYLIIVCLLLMVNISFSDTRVVGIEINGSGVAFNESSGYPYVDQNNRTMVPLRAAMTSFGAEVGWNSITNTAEVRYMNQEVMVPIGTNYIILNGNKIINDTYSVLKNGRVYLPIKIVLESFGADVSWNGANSKVVVKKGDVESYYRDIMALSDVKYDGKVPGTMGYKLAAEYISKRLSSYNVTPVIGDHFIYEYQTDLTELVSENVIIGQKKLSLMVDYMPFSRTSNTSISGEKTFIYVNSGVSSDYANKDVNGKIVVFSYFDQNGRFPLGVLDRINIAKSKGAIGVIIEANGELKVGHYEHPVNGEDAGIFACYITPELFSDLGFSNATNVGSKVLSCDINLSIKHTSNVISQNIVGEIKGKNADKNIVLVTNLDGFGKLPDGYVYQNATYSAVTPALFIDLARYYSQNKPESNIIFVIVGDKWTKHQGIKDFLNRFSRSSVTMVDFYSAGYQNNNVSLGFYKDSKSAVKDYMKQIYPVSEMTDTGNALFSDFKTVYQDALFIRGDHSWFDQAKEDKANAFELKPLKADQNIFRKLVDDLIKQQSGDFIYSTNYSKIYNAVAGREYLTLESKYFKVLFDESYKLTVANVDFLKEIDKIYDRMGWYNFYPTFSVKPYAIFSTDTISAAKIGERRDVYENGHDVGGGFASFINSTTDVIFCLHPSFYTVSHELNHLFVNETLHRRGVNSTLSAYNSEAHGHTHMITYSGPNYVFDMENKVTAPFYNASIMKVVEDTFNNAAGKFEWGNLNGTKRYDHQVVYHIYASMYDFIFDNYGREAMRYAIFKVYESPSILDEASSMTDVTGLTPEQFIQQWVEWMRSKGVNKVESNLLSLKKSSEAISLYNAYWNRDSLKLDKAYWDSYEKMPSVSSSQTDYTNTTTRTDFSSQRGVMHYFDIPFNNAFKSVGNTYYKANIGTENDRLVIQLMINDVSQPRNLVLFLESDYPGLKYLVSVDKNIPVVTFKLDINLVSTFERGIVLNPGDFKFLFFGLPLIKDLIK